MTQFRQMIYLTQINQAMTLKSISDFSRVHSPMDLIDPKTSEGYINFHASYLKIRSFVLVETPWV